jgi:hypothetical protein
MKLEHNKNIVKLISELPEARPAGYVGKKIQGGFFPLALRIASLTAVREHLTDERGPSRGLRPSAPITPISLTSKALGHVAIRLRPDENRPKFRLDI